MNYNYSLKLAVNGTDDEGDKLGATLDVDIDQNNNITLTTTDAEGTLTYSNNSMEELRETVTRVMRDLTTLRQFMVMMEQFEHIVTGEVSNDGTVH